jgi:pectinesterase
MPALSALPALVLAPSLVLAPALGGTPCRPPAAEDVVRIVVATDGSGDATSAQDAVDLAPTDFAGRVEIVFEPGRYAGQVVVDAAHQRLSFLGATGDPDDVVITDDRAAGTPKPGGGTWGTTGSASVTIKGADFRAEAVTFENAFDEAAHPEISGHQAVAVKTAADRVAFENVRFLGNQDTLYLDSPSASVPGRVYVHDSYVEGDVDFIFGRATAVLDRCRVHSLDRDSTPSGYVTAPSTMITNRYGLLFTHCRFTSDAPPGSVFLGRPWHPSQDPSAIGQTIIRDSVIGAHIGPVAWTDFGTWPWREARLAEYRNIGPGAIVSADRPQLTRAEAAEYTVAKVLHGTDGWRPDSCP